MVHLRAESRCRPGVAAVLVGLVVAVAAGPAQARQVLFVNDYFDNTVGEYNSVTGATINAAFTNGNGLGLSGPGCLALDTSNHLFVGYSNNFNAVIKYDATTGSTLGGITSNQGLAIPECLATDGNNHFFVGEISGLGGPGPIFGIVGRFDATAFTPINNVVKGPLGSSFNALVADKNNHVFVATNNGTVGQYDATSSVFSLHGFIVGLNTPEGLALDALNHLFVADNGNGSVGEYDATTGTAINPNFIPGLNGPAGMALDGNNHLFVVNNANGTVGEYDATTGATIDANFITGLNGANAIAFMAPVPEPSSLLLVAATAVVGIYRRRPRNC